MLSEMLFFMHLPRAGFSCCSTPDQRPPGKAKQQQTLARRSFVGEGHQQKNRRFTKSMPIRFWRNGKNNTACCGYGKQVEVQTGKSKALIRYGYTPGSLRFEKNPVTYRCPCIGKSIPAGNNQSHRLHKARVLQSRN